MAHSITTTTNNILKNKKTYRQNNNYAKQDMNMDYKNTLLSFLHENNFSNSKQKRAQHTIDTLNNHSKPASNALPTSNLLTELALKSTATTPTSLSFETIGSTLKKSLNLNFSDGTVVSDVVPNEITKNNNNTVLDESDNFVKNEIEESQINVEITKSTPDECGKLTVYDSLDASHTINIVEQIPKDINMPFETQPALDIKPDSEYDKTNITNDVVPNEVCLDGKWDYWWAEKNGDLIHTGNDNWYYIGAFDMIDHYDVRKETSDYDFVDKITLSETSYTRRFTINDYEYRYRTRIFLPKNLSNYSISKDKKGFIYIRDKLDSNWNIIIESCKCPYYVSINGWFLNELKYKYEDDISTNIKDAHADILIPDATNPNDNDVNVSPSDDTEIKTTPTMTDTITESARILHVNPGYKQGDYYKAEGGLILTNLNVDKNLNVEKPITFDVYNTKDAMGIVEYYDENGEFIRADRIEPHDVVIKDFDSWWEKTKNLIDSITKYNFGDVPITHPSISEHTRIEAPKGTNMIVITNNKNESIYAQAYNFVDYFFTIHKLYKNVKDLFESYDAFQTNEASTSLIENVKENIVKRIINNIQKNIGSMANYKTLLKKLGEEGVKNLALQGFNLQEAFEDSFEYAVKNSGKIALDKVKDIASKACKEILKGNPAIFGLDAMTFVGNLLDSLSKSVTEKQLENVKPIILQLEH